MKRMSSLYSKTYDELLSLISFEDRLNYLLLNGSVCQETFGYNRYLNQLLYRCSEWKTIRRNIIIRDKGLDLACDGYEIQSGAIVHHINPITVEDILNRNPIIFDPNNLITTRLATHNIIHYGTADEVKRNAMIEREPNDTCPWRR